MPENVLENFRHRSKVKILILQFSPKSGIKSSVISHNKGNDLGYALGYLRNAKYA